MITISLDQGHYPSAKVEFRPATERTTDHGAIMIEAAALINERLAQLKAAKTAVTPVEILEEKVEVKTETHGKAVIEPPKEERELEESIQLPPSPHSLSNLAPTPTPAPAPAPAPAPTETSTPVAPEPEPVVSEPEPVENPTPVEATPAPTAEKSEPIS